MMNKSKHAVILAHESGMQLLIHIGINTVSLKGEGFTTYVQTGDTVKAGQLLIEFDVDAIQQAGLSTATPVIIPSGTEQVAGLTVKASQGRVTANKETVMDVQFQTK